MYTCAQCKVYRCRSGELDQLPTNCPCGEDQAEIQSKYHEPENQLLAYQSALVEAEGYCQKTRLEETMEFARKCDFQKIGLAFCYGLRKEAEILTKILKHNGFQVESVICKNGSFPKELIGIEEHQKLRPGTREPMCNPIGQAELLNREKTDFNLVLGLCVGHDSLFLKYSEAPVSVFAVKDRVLAHNPLGAIYTSEGYYKNKLFR